MIVTSESSSRISIQIHITQSASEVRKTSCHLNHKPTLKFYIQFEVTMYCSEILCEKDNKVVQYVLF